MTDSGPVVKMEPLFGDDEGESGDNSLADSITETVSVAPRYPERAPDVKDQLYEIIIR